MGKIGIGVGEEFPIDEDSGDNDRARDPGDDREEYEAWRRRRQAWQAQQAAYQARRDEWRERKRAFREEMRARVHAAMEHADSAVPRAQHRAACGRRGFGRGFGYRPGLMLLLPLLGIVLLVALVSAAVQQPFLMLAAVLFAGAAAGHLHRRHHDHFHGGRRFGEGQDHGVRT